MTQQKAVKGQPGRKDLYEVKVLPRLAEIVGLVRKGINEGGLKKLFEVDSHTWVNYKAAHPELAEAIQEGKDQLVSDLLENSVTRAKERFVDEYDPRTGKNYRRWHDGDTGMAIFLMCNLAPDQFKNRQLQQLTGADGKEVVINVKYDQPAVKS